MDLERVAEHLKQSFTFVKPARITILSIQSLAGSSVLVIYQAIYGENRSETRVRCFREIGEQWDMIIA